MKRRTALQNIAIVTATVPMLPGCDTETYPVYENIPVTKKQRKLIEQLSNISLPINNPEVTTPEKTIDYILTVFNDCYAPEDITSYLSGLNEFQLLLKEKYSRNLNKMKPEKRNELFTELMNGENNSEALNYFFDQTFYLTKQHFTSSEFFLKNYKDFEFVPGRYIGCKEV